MKIAPDRRVLLAALALSACATTPAPEAAFSNELRDTPPDDVIDLWPEGAPGGERVTVAEELVERPNDLGLRDRIVRGVRTPTLSLFRPTNADGSAVLIIPGGGYRHVVVRREASRRAALPLTCCVTDCRETIGPRAATLRFRTRSAPCVSFARNRAWSPTVLRRWRSRLADMSAREYPAHHQSVLQALLAVNFDVIKMVNNV